MSEGYSSNCIVFFANDAYKSTYATTETFCFLIVYPLDYRYLCATYEITESRFLQRLQCRASLFLSLCHPVLTMASESLCGDLVSSRRGLLAMLWSIVNMLTFFAFVVALSFAILAKNGDYENVNDDGGDGDGEPEQDEEFQADIAVTSRAMAFAALWTAVLASLMGLFGTVILGFQSPTGQYYTCCSSGVHRTTPLGMGSFIGSLIMFANLTLVCSVLFGEFEVRDT